MIAPPADALAAPAHPDPYPYYAELVARAPLAHDPRLGLWVAAGDPACRAALAHPGARVRPSAEPVPAALAGTPAGALFGRLVRQRDDPARLPLRSALAAGLAGLAPGIVEARASALAALLGEPGGAPGAWLDDLARRLPAASVAALLGAPDDEALAAAAWLPALAAGLAPGADSPARDRASAAAGELTRLAAGLLARGGGDLGGPLLAAGAGAEDMAANAAGLLLQSYDATAGLIGNTLVALGRRPDLAPPAAAGGAALESLLAEVLRYDAPVQNTRRFFPEGAELAGERLPPGAAVLVVLAAANRDPRANPEPHALDPGRAEPRCLTLGLGGHACPGGRIALGVAAAAVRRAVAAGVDLGRAAAGVRYRPLTNARVPIFAEEVNL